MKQTNFRTRKARKQSIAHRNFIAPAVPGRNAGRHQNIGMIHDRRGIHLPRAGALAMSIAAVAAQMFRRSSARGK